MKTTPIPVKFDRQGHSCNFYVGFGLMLTTLKGFTKIHVHDFRPRQRKQPCKKVTLLGTASGHSLVNLPGWCWAEIQQFALVGSSSSLHSEACNALGASDGVIHSRISQEEVSLRATSNNSLQQKKQLRGKLHHQCSLVLCFFPRSPC